MPETGKKEAADILMQIQNIINEEHFFMPINTDTAVVSLTKGNASGKILIKQ